MLTYNYVIFFVHKTGFRYKPVRLQRTFRKKHVTYDKYDLSCKKRNCKILSRRNSKLSIIAIFSSWKKIFEILTKIPPV